MVFYKVVLALSWLDINNKPRSQTKKSTEKSKNIVVSIFMHFYEYCLHFAILITQQAEYGIILAFQWSKEACYLY